MRLGDDPGGLIRCLLVFREEFEDTKRIINHNPYIEEEQTTQWPKEKVQKDKQRSTTQSYI